MALAMQARVGHSRRGWRKRGYDLQMGMGIAQGFATFGAIGFEGRIDYGAIGTVTNLAARLCGEARGGETLLAQRVMAALDGAFKVEPVGRTRAQGLSASGGGVYRLLAGCSLRAPF